VASNPQTQVQYARWLYLLTGLFLFRISAQLIVAVVDVAYLPAFEYWHSGTMPYELLLIFQCLIFFVMVKTAFSFSNNNISPNKIIGEVLLIMGMLYLVTMLLRIVLGLILFTDSRWFTNYIPTFFHIILATYVLLVGHFHYRYAIKSGAQ